MTVMITGTGSYLPETIVTNEQFKDSRFYSPAGVPLQEEPEIITSKFRGITGIIERRYAAAGQRMSDMAAIAADRAIKDAAINPEEIDGIILAHNFGDVVYGTAQVDLMPCTAVRVKHALNISNPDCVAFDIVFGCAGWLQAMILARQYLFTENASRILIIAGETLSRVIDPHDRDSMIYADGAAAAIVEAVPSKAGEGIIATCSQSYCQDEAFYLYYGESNNNCDQSGKHYLKMHGKKIYEFALKYVPLAMKQCLDKAGIDIRQLKKIFIHQANEKMNKAILNRFYGLYEIDSPPDNIMPMNIFKLGNSSVATIPTLLDEVLKKKHPEHRLEKGDTVLFAAVGAGMNISAVTYVI